MNTYAVWILVMILSPYNNGQTSVVIDDIPTEKECERMVEIIKEVRRPNNSEVHACIRRLKAKP